MFTKLPLYYFKYFVCCILLNRVITIFVSETCTAKAYCYGSNLCRSPYPQNFIKPEALSATICFNKTVTFMMGTDNPIIKSDGENPSREVILKPFCMDLTQVSNLQFLQFVTETNYITQAEKLGDSLCLEKSLSLKAKNYIAGYSSTQWWVNVRNATWFNPEGPDSHIYSRLEHPVIHVSWNDANNYCKYFKKRLPTEAEWEYICRGGLKNRLYPWGNKEVPSSGHMMNIWQGDFPDLNTADDGFEYTAPVDQFVQNKFHVKNIVGNVWEWTNDWWSINHYKYNKIDPIGSGKEKEKVKKGGSFMCHPSFCHRYRCAARSKNTPDTTAMNIGFRCAF